MIRIRTNFNGPAGAPYLSTAYFDNPDLTAAAAAQLAVRTFWDGLKGYITTGVSILVDSQVDLIDPATGDTTDSVSLASTVISSTGNAPLPKATQGLIRWRTGVFVAGREVRGRTFVPALANDAQLGGVPSVGFVGSCNAAAAGLIAASPGGGQFVVWSRRTPLPAVVASSSTWDQFAVLRSRRD